MTEWRNALELSSERKVAAGCESNLAEAIRRGADLRVYTEFRHNEHIDVTSHSSERIAENMDFRVTYLLDNRWTAGVISLRQPIALPGGFGPRSSMSFFLYNQDARQALARVCLDGVQPTCSPGPSAPASPPNMPKYRTLDSWDEDTNAPSSNFVYDFDVYRFFVRDTWREALSHTEDGSVVSGSVEDLADAFSQGCEVKVGVSGLAADFKGGEASLPDHRLFVHGGSCYYYTEQKIFITGTHPVIRVRPAIPLVYTTRGWDVGWLMVRTDGLVVYRRCDPYTLTFEDVNLSCAVRWFVR